jgi:hypothetical protein
VVHNDLCIVFNAADVAHITASIEGHDAGSGGNDSDLRRFPEINTDAPPIFPRDIDHR